MISKKVPLRPSRPEKDLQACPLTVSPLCSLVAAWQLPVAAPWQAALPELARRARKSAQVGEVAQTRSVLISRPEV
jgi:hypothetical protein